MKLTDKGSIMVQRAKGAYRKIVDQHEAPRVTSSINQKRHEVKSQEINELGTHFTGWLHISLGRRRAS